MDQQQLARQAYQNDFGPWHRYIKKSRANLLIMPMVVMLLPILLHIFLFSALSTPVDAARSTDSLLSFLPTVVFLIHMFVQLLLTAVFLGGSFLFHRKIVEINTQNPAPQHQRLSAVLTVLTLSTPSPSAYIMRALLSVIPPFSVFSIWLVWAHVWRLQTNLLDLDALAQKKPPLPWWLHLWGIAYGAGFLALLRLVFTDSFAALDAVLSPHSSTFFGIFSLFIASLSGFYVLFIGLYQHINRIYLKSR